MQRSAEQRIRTGAAWGLGLVLAAWCSTAYAEPLVDARLGLAQAEQALSDLQADLARRQALHSTLVGRVEEFKGRPIQAFRLEGLQRAASAMADEVAAAQRRVASGREARAAAQRTLREALRARLSRLEAEVPAGATERAGWLAEQSRLGAELARLEPLRALTPPLDAPTGALQPSDGPEELRELADELADLRERHLGHADSLARQIGALQRQRRLLRLSDDLEREEGLFDEAQRFRSARRVAASRSGREAAPGAEHAGTEAETDKRDGMEAASPPHNDGGHAAAPGPGAAEDDADGWRDEADPNGVAAGGFHGDQPGSSTGAELGLPEQPVSPAPEPASQALPAAAPRTDPRMGIADPRSLDGLGLDEQLRQLELLRDRTEVEARRLEERIRALRARARSLEVDEAR